MYNFPHQINDLAKLQRALAVFQSLATQSKDLRNDAVVGVSMAESGVYAFRDKTLSLRQALQAERRKSRSSQGTQAFARDLRRFFLLLGFLEVDLAGQPRMSLMGDYVLGLEISSEEARATWRTALRHLAIVTSQDDDIAHPYQILLRLVEARPGIEPSRLALALEARDDSDEEFARILALADKEDWSEVRGLLGVSEHLARDATKILPALGRQLGDLRSERNRYFRLDPDVDELIDVLPEVPGRPAEPRARARRARRRSRAGGTTRPGTRRVSAQTIARAPQPNDRPRDEREFADPEQTAELRRDRLERHEGVVRRLAELLDSDGYSFFEDPFDLLRVHVDFASILAEVKTLDRSAIDEIAQVRAALSQLLYYDAFEVSADLRSNGLVLLAVFERPVAEDHIAFLESHGIAVGWLEGDALVCNSTVSVEALARGGLSLPEAS